MSGSFGLFATGAAAFLLEVNSMLKLCSVIFSIISNAFNTCGNSIAEGIEDRNGKQIAAYFGLLVLLVVACVAGTLGLLYLAYCFWWIILVVYLAGAGLYTLLHPTISTKEVNNEIDLIIAEEDAKEAHSELRALAYHAVLDTSENTSLIRPRDEFSIESSREKPFYQDGSTVMVHQFEVDYNGALESNQLNNILRDLQRQFNKYAPRYPLLIREGHPPVVYDLKNTGNFLILEVILYSESAREKIEARRRARINRQLKIRDIYDRDF